MKRIIKPDYSPLRKKEYEKRDGRFCEAVEDMARTLKENGIDIGGIMTAELIERDKIRTRFKK